MSYDVHGHKADSLNVFTTLFKAEHYKCSVLTYSHVLSSYEHNCTPPKDISFYMKWMLVGLDPSICHDQQNTSPVREICVFGEKNKKQFGIITLQQHVHRFTALEKNIICSNRMAKELYQIRLWRTRYLRVRICMHSSAR